MANARNWLRRLHKYRDKIDSTVICFTATLNMMVPAPRALVKILRVEGERNQEDAYE